MGIKHRMQSTVPDEGVPPYAVKPSDWNDEHEVDGLLGALIGLALQPGIVPYLDANSAGATFSISDFVRASLMAASDAAVFRDAIGVSPTDSGALTGTPTAPTAGAGTNTDQIATTKFVTAAIAALIASAPAALDTLNELATALGNDANFASTVTNSLALKAPLASPTFTGAPLAPTAAPGDNSTKVATTAYADAAIVVLQGIINTALALKAPLASPAFTGNPTTATTPAPGDNSTKIPNTAFVAAAVAASGAGTVKKNYLGNPAFQVSQRNGTTAGTATGYYPADRWQYAFSNAGAVSVAQVAKLSPGGSPNRIRVTVTTADAAVGATDYAAFSHYVEGAEFADLAFGTVGAHSVTKRFGVNAPAGTYCVAIRNQAGNRGIVGECTIAAGEANTDVVKTVTFTGDVTGTWLTGIGQTGAIVTWCLMAGTNWQTAANAWGTSGAIGTANQFNFMGTVGNVFELFDVGLYDGTSAPAWQKPKFGDEMRECQRFYESTYSYGVQPGTATTQGADQIAYSLNASWGQSGHTIMYKVTKCKVPTVTPYSPNSGAAGHGWDAASGSDVTPNIPSLDIGTNAFRSLLAPSAVPQVYSLITHYVIDASLN